MDEDLRAALNTQNAKLDRISQALYGSVADSQSSNKVIGKGLIEVVSEHETEIQSFRDFKSKGKLLWKITIVGLTVFGYAFGKGIEHFVLHIEHLVFLFSHTGH
jgi:hypothetical protein